MKMSMIVASIMAMLMGWMPSHAPLDRMDDKAMQCQIEQEYAELVAQNEKLRFAYQLELEYQKMKGSHLELMNALQQTP